MGYEDKNVSNDSWIFVLLFYAPHKKIASPLGLSPHIQHAQYFWSWKSSICNLGMQDGNLNLNSLVFSKHNSNNFYRFSHKVQIMDDLDIRRLNFYKVCKLRTIKLWPTICHYHVWYVRPKILRVKSPSCLWVHVKLQI